MQLLYEPGAVERLDTGVRSIVSWWGFSPSATVTLLNLSENATYHAMDDASGHELILRVYRPGYRTRPEILSELAWIEVIRAERIVSTPAPVHTIDGSLLCSFEDSGQQRYVGAFEYLRGREPNATDDLVPWFERLGATTARLHQQSRAWSRPPGFIRKSWTYETILGPSPYWGNWRAALGLDASGMRILERTEALLRRQLAQYGMAHDRFGLIHADLRLANLLVRDDDLAVIDFDDCGFSWFCFDFAAAVTFIEHEPYLPSLKAAWTAGYRRAVPLAVEDELALEMFVMLRRMQVTAWIASHSETRTAQEMGIPYTEGTVRLADAYLARPS